MSVLFSELRVGLQNFILNCTPKSQNIHTPWHMCTVVLDLIDGHMAWQNVKHLIYCEGLGGGILHTHHSVIFVIVCNWIFWSAEHQQVTLTYYILIILRKGVPGSFKVDRQCFYYLKLYRNSILPFSLFTERPTQFPLKLWSFACNFLFSNSFKTLLCVIAAAMKVM